MSTVALDAPRIVRPSWGAVGRVLLILGKIFLNAVVSLVIVLAVWELFILLTGIDSFVARNPVDVWHYLFTQTDAGAHRSELFNASLTT